MITKKFINEVSYQVIGCAIEVHKNLGPGLLESVYQQCFFEELKWNGLNPEEQVSVPVSYKGVILGKMLKMDLLVNNLLIIEIKAVEVMIPLYKAQLLSYLKLANKPKGLLINFNCESIKSQMVSMVTDSFLALPQE